MKYEIPPIMVHNISEAADQTEGSVKINDLDGILYASRQAISEGKARAIYPFNRTEGCEDALFTFDDGLSCHWSEATPWLEKHRLRGVFFIHSEPIEKGYDKFLSSKEFAVKEFESMDDFYEEYEFLSEQLGFHDANFIVPQNFLREFEFYSVSDRRHRFLRDMILGSNGHEVVISKMMSSKKVRFQDYSTAGIWLKKEEIKEISKKGHRIGLHTHSHPTDMSRLTNDEQKKEITRNKCFLEEIIGEKIIDFAYPCGRYNKTTLMIAEHLGIKFGYKSNFFETNSDLEIPRVDVASALQFIGGISS